jgi:hypothetical protein
MTIMFNVICESVDGARSCRTYNDRDSAVKAVGEMARTAQAKTPNNPTIQGCGANSIAVCIGVQKIYTFTLVAKV